MSAYYTVVEPASERDSLERGPLVTVGSSERNHSKEINQLLENIGRDSSSLLPIPAQLLVTGHTVLYTTVHKTQGKYQLNK